MVMRQAKPESKLTYTTTDGLVFEGTFSQREAEMHQANLNLNANLKSFTQDFLILNIVDGMTREQVLTELLGNIKKWNSKVIDCVDTYRSVCTVV